MLIDRKSRPWIFACVAIFATATCFFVRYWHATRGHPSGGSWTGLAFGAGGSLAMVVAMLLALRKKTRSLRLGRPYYWMQAHVWFGLLSYPLILYHAGGFCWGGTLTQVLMWLFTLVFISGIIGIILQQVIPNRLVRDVPAETIAAQIGHVLETLRQEAEAIVQPLRADANRDRPGLGAASKANTGKAAAVATLEAPAGDSGALALFYTQKIVPFLASRFHRRSPLGDISSARMAFAQLRSQVSENFHPAVASLESLVDERRQLARQSRLNGWLHGWLLIHVPLSYAMMVLGIIHGIMAFRFTTPQW